MHIVERSTDDIQVDMSYRLEPGTTFGVFVKTYYNSWKHLHAAVSLEWERPEVRRRAPIEHAMSVHGGKAAGMSRKAGVHAKHTH